MFSFVVMYLTVFIIKSVNSNFSFDLILQKTISDINPYQVTFFSPDFIIHNQSKISSGIFTEFPSLRLGSNVHRKFLKNSTVLKNTLQTSLVIIHANDINFAEQVMDFLSETVPMYERPKFLCVLLNGNSNFQKSIKSLLVYAWEQKILDFTLVQPTSNDILPPLMYHYNPFHHFIDSQLLNINTSMFPNKLRSINNYIIKVGRGGENLSGDNYEDQEAEWARQKLMVNFVLKNMGFKLQHVNHLDNPILYDWHYNSLWFTNVSTNVIGGLVIPKESNEQIAAVFSGLECRSVLAVVPIIFVPKVIVPVKIFIYIFVVPGIVFCFIHFINHFSRRIQFFKIFHAVQIFLGQSPKFFSSTLIQKIIYVNIIVLFVMITNDLYSGIVEIKFDKEEVPFESLEDLDNSGMSLYSKDFYEGLNLFDSLDDPVRKSLDSKVQLHPNCMEYMIQTRSHICIDWEYDIKAFIEKNRNLDGSAIMKIAKSKYHCDLMFIQFEPGSPYMRQFARVNRRIRESGLMQMEYISNGFVKRIKNIELNEKKDEKNLSEQQILFILSIGYFFAVLTFIIEYSVKVTQYIQRKIYLHLQ